MSIPLTPQPGGSHRAPARMPSSPPAPLVYSNHTPNHLDVPWGMGPNEVCDIYQTAAPGPHQVLFWLHGGAGVKGDLRQCSMGGNGLGSAIIDYVRSNVLPLDVVSVGYEKFDWRQATPCSHIPQYVPTPWPTLFPANVNRLSALWSWVAASCTFYGWSEDNHHLGGVSHGGVLAMLSRFANAAPVKSLIIESPLGDYRDPNIWWPVGEGMSGAPDQSTWDAVLDSDKQAMSAILQVASNPCPMFLANASVGDHTPPFGSTSGGNVHDSLQMTTLAAELTANSLEHQLKLYPRGALDTPKLGTGIAAAAYAFLAAHNA